MSKRCIIQLHCAAEYPLEEDPLVPNRQSRSVRCDEEKIPFPTPSGNENSHRPSVSWSLCWLSLHVVEANVYLKSNFSLGREAGKYKCKVHNITMNVGVSAIRQGSVRVILPVLLPFLVSHGYSKLLNAPMSALSFAVGVLEILNISLIGEMPCCPMFPYFVFSWWPIGPRVALSNYGVYCLIRCLKWNTHSPYVTGRRKHSFDN